MLREDSLSSPTCQLGTRVWVTVSVSPPIPPPATSGVHQSPFSSSTFTALPSPTGSSAAGCESLAPGAAGRGGSSLPIWCFLFDSPLSSSPWNPMSALGAPQLGPRALGCSWPLWPAHSPSSWVRELGSNPSMATSCLCHIAHVKPGSLHLSSGLRKVHLMCRGFMTKCLWHLAPLHMERPVTVVDSTQTWEGGLHDSI